MTADQIVANLTETIQRGKASAELIIEETVNPPTGVVCDYKLYCFYGAVGLIAVIARDTRNHLRFRHFWPDGTDAGDVRPGQKYDPELPAPTHLKELIVAGETLSAALPEPFVRLDFLEDADRVVFGEVTPNPGGDQLFRYDVDKHLGSLWEAAEAKLRVEAISAGVHDPRFGRP